MARLMRPFPCRCGGTVTDLIGNKPQRPQRSVFSLVYTAQAIPVPLGISILGVFFGVFFVLPG